MSEASPPELDREAFRAKYGPWAVVAGGSEGSGEAFARRLAELGLNLVIIARRLDVLHALADDIIASHGVNVRVLSQDLMAPGAAQRIMEATADVEVGLFVSNAGVDASGGWKFFEQPLERWQKLIRMNVQNLTAAVHGFGNRFIARGRGGLLIMGSGSALGGSPYIATYSATKAFEMVLTEGVWGELQGTGVDALYCIGPPMATEKFKRNVAGKGFELGNIFTPEEVVEKCLARLGHQVLVMFSDVRADPDRYVKQRYDALQVSLRLGRSYLPRETSAAS